MPDPLPINAPVRILKHQHTGWCGKVRAEKYGQYIVGLTHDADGDALAYVHTSGPYCRRELELLTDPQTGHPSPTIQDMDVPFFPGAA